MEYYLITEFYYPHRGFVSFFKNLRLWFFKNRQLWRYLKYYFD
ncbi:hypothetical protein KCO_12837 [Pectobacterium brasiliense ICMP 19477]|nr:hypothetical protein KCO_12837 [Pectobacterium brasiliense ICMP 19477]